MPSFMELYKCTLLFSGMHAFGRIWLEGLAGEAHLRALRWPRLCLPPLSKPSKRIAAADSVTVGQVGRNLRVTFMNKTIVGVVP